MRPWQVIFVLLLAAAIFGPAGYFIYKIVYEPKVLEEKAREEEKRLASLPPPPDPTAPFLQEAVRLKKADNLPAAKSALENFLDQYPKSPLLNDAKQLLGELNTAIYLSSRPSPDKTEYVVKSGDSLLKVESQTKAPVELIMRANNLESIRLQIGQRLYVPKVDFTVTISFGAERLELINNGRFFKQYSYEPVNLPAALAKGAKTKVVEKAAWWQGERVTFEAPEYIQSSRWISLADGSTIFSPAPESWNLPDPGRGYRMKQSDVAEIQALIKLRTPVTIVP